MSKITLEQLQEHDGVKNQHLWTVLYDKVYDLSEFADKHPGGREMIESACARDATALFESYHLSSESIARSYLKGTGGSIKYVGEFDVESAKVGNQDELPNDAAIKFTFQSPLSASAQKSNRTNIYEIMKQRIRNDLINNESSGFKRNIRRVSGLRLFNAIFIFTGLLTCQILSQYFPTINLGVAILLGLLAGLFHHLALVHVVHDLGHGSFTDFPVLWRLIGNFGSYVLGQSYYVWTIRHNVGHHVYTNMSEIDPDVGVYEWKRHVDASTPSTVSNATCVKNEKVDLVAKMYSEPKDYNSVPVDIMAKTGSFGSLPFLYASLIFYMQIVDFVHYWTRHVSEGIAFASPTLSSTTFHFYGSKIFFCFYRIILPIMLFDRTGGLIGRNSLETLVTFFATEIVAGIMFGFLSQINHISEKCAWPSNVMNEMVDNSNEENGGKDDLDWAAIQVTTCIDYCHDSYLWTYLSGFLNYQVIHHLFPGVNPWLYPKLLPIVKKVCKENNVAYTIYNNFSDALDSHVKQLTSFSKKQLLKTKILDH